MPQSKFLLPALSMDAAIAPTNPGCWEGRSMLADELTKLANGLEVAVNRNRPESIDSIPDIWARPIFFKMALYASNENHFDAELHKKIKGEWRAILAMLALKDMRNLNLTVDAVHLNTGGTSVAPLESILLNLAPKDSITLDPNNPGNWSNDWKDIYVISYNDKPIAITSPTTLVAASADYSSELAGQIMQPWSDNGKYLTDPIQELSAEEISGLTQWLQNLLNGLQNNIPFEVKDKNDTCKKLFATLNEYINDVNARLMNMPVVSGINVVQQSTPMMTIGVFRFLDYKVQAPPPTPASSYVRLIPSSSRANSATLLIISPKMLNDISKSRGIPTSQIFVWTGLTANNIAENSLQGNRNMIGNVTLGATQWRRPEEFFTDKLAIFRNNGKVFKGVRYAHGIDILSTQNYSVILPLKKEILEYFESDEIIRRFHIENIGNNTFKVTFDFPLSGRDGDNIIYTAEKCYHVQETLSIQTTIPVIEIWPNFKRKDWKKYYLYYENSEAQNQSQIAGNDFFYVYPYAYGENIAGDTPNLGLENQYTARLLGFPEALICTLKWTNGGRNYTSELIDAGLILLENPKNVNVHFNVDWNVGIDFGTSSTMLYQKSLNNAPHPLNLQPNLFQVTESGDLRNRTYLNFIPASTADQQSGSFLSIFQMLRNLQQGIPIRPLQDGNIFWLLSADGPDAVNFRDNNRKIDTNLKWTSTPSDKMKVISYIHQICLQILAEAAQNEVFNIEWNFSYPTAFSDSQRQDFTAACRQAVNAACQDTGFSNQTLKYWTESQASAYYFSTVGGVALAGGAICLDIGAGTTDISVVSGTPAKIVYHTSLQFAGRYLFKSIYQNYGIFAKSSINFGTMNDQQKNSLIDADMRKHNEQYLENLININGNQEVARALKIAQFAAAGIFYYLGGLISLLHEMGIYEEDQIPKIHIGGNGARIFSWICGNNFGINENVRMSVFKDMFEATSGLKGAFSPFLSPKPKVEVAQGMVDPIAAVKDFFDNVAIADAIFGEAGADPLIADSVFAGDAFIKNNDPNPHPKTEFISAYDIKKGIQIKSVNELENFVEKFNANHQIWDLSSSITISKSQIDNVRRAVSGIYAMQMTRNVHDIFVEPVFILELKKFLEML